MNNAVKNIIFLALTKSKLNNEMLSKITGINQEELEIYLNNLIEEKAIKKEDNLYSLYKNGEPKK